MADKIEAYKHNQVQATGAIEIAPQVIENIAAATALQSKGVRAIKRANKTIQDVFQRDAGVILYQNNRNDMVLDMSVELYFGTAVIAVAQNIQSQVIDQVKYMTDITIDVVNVHVTNLYMEKASK
ncbi:Asp23/Gls24 family envelope stress response protein [Aerococcus urinaeequi]|uniref:Asp23/Gls24 family envelope stress response protein n=1 Tax=Aerococcus urinaeequi TaxID=51665 RepID=UPI003AB039F8